MSEVTMWIENGRLYMRTPYRLRTACRSMPGSRWDPKEKAWHVPATTAAAAAAGRVLAGLATTHAGTGVPELFEGVEKVKDAQAYKESIDLPNTPTKTSAWLHQRQAFHFAKELDGAMLAMDMGTGKSLTAIGLLEEWKAMRVLIACPRSVIRVWPNQFNAHALRDTWEIIAPTKGTVARRSRDAAKRVLWAQTHGRPFVLVVNYESVWRGEFAELVTKMEWDAVLLDESHRVKSAGGKASMFITRLRNQARHRLCLTGTPMPHSPLDIYAQYRFLDPGVFGSSKNRFQNRYCVMGGFENRQIVGWDNQEELSQKIGQIAFFVSKDEALPDLPQWTHVERTFDLATETYVTYAGLEKDFVAGVEEGIVTATNALTKLIRLRQVTSGFVKTDDDVIRRLSDDREKLLADVLSDLPQREPVVVFCVFHEDLNAIERVAAAQGRRYGELSGRRRDGLNENAQMAENIDIIGVQLQSGGVGIDLTRAGYGIYYSVDFNLGNFEQSLARLDRPGQTRHGTYIHLIAQRPESTKSTIDGTVYKALRNRKSVIEAVIDAAKGRAE